jgi:hypothetical protein
MHVMKKKCGSDPVCDLCWRHSVALLGGWAGQRGFIIKAKRLNSEGGVR